MSYGYISNYFFIFPDMKKLASNFKKIWLARTNEIWRSFSLFQMAFMTFQWLDHLVFYLYDLLGSTCPSYHCIQYDTWYRYDQEISFILQIYQSHRKCCFLSKSENKQAYKIISQLLQNCIKIEKKTRTIILIGFF